MFKELMMIVSSLDCLLKNLKDAQDNPRSLMIKAEEVFKMYKAVEKGVLAYKKIEKLTDQFVEKVNLLYPSMVKKWHIYFIDRSTAFFVFRREDMFMKTDQYSVTLTWKGVEVERSGTGVVLVDHNKDEHLNFIKEIINL